MSEFEPIEQQVLEEPSLVSLRNTSSDHSQVLIPLNGNANNTSSNITTSNNGNFEDPDGANGNEGASSASKKSKRPSKPSSALMQAKLNAQKQKKHPGFDIPIVIKDHLQPARDAKDVVRKSTGVVYDMRMVEHFCMWDSEYPENPDRFSVVVKRCQELGLLDRCKSIPPRFATEEEILCAHPKEHIEKLRRICQDSNVSKLEECAADYDAIYFHPSTYDMSLLAAGCSIDLVSSILDGVIQNGMAIVRPPGHHAMESEYCGYCFFNNAAIAAKLALHQGKAQKILIVDFDVHHGQATQQMFYDDPRVLYFSIHRFENGMFWPNLEESNFNYIGTSDGIGFNCNIPLNKTGMGNTDYLSVWHQVLLPLAYQFQAQLTIVSAGYDSAFGDEKGEMEVTPACYPHLIWPLMGLSSGKLALLLEGGYCLKSLAEASALSLRTLLGDPCPMIPPTSTPTVEIVDTILNSTYVLKPYWSMLVGQRAVYVEEEEQKTEDDEVHVPQVKYLWEEPKPDKYATRNCYPVQNSEVLKTLDERLDQLILTTKLEAAIHRVGIVYDDIMLKHRNNSEPGHPERPERISNIFACHADYGLLERCYRIESRQATDEELLLVHTEEHISKMKSTQTMNNKDLNNLKENFNSVYLHNHTYQAALISAGSVLQVVDSVLNGICQSGVAIVRPPGHHAESDEPCGFCIFNNVGLAAQYALNTHGLKRILLVDWDVHHGNGCQRMFENDSRVLYVSIHRYDHGSFFPCSEEADYLCVGKGNGEGFNVNIPWNKSGMTDTEYMAAFTNVILPIAYEYGPELVLVAAGFDAAKGDPLGGCKLSPEMYGQMTHLLSSLANGRIILALEGGYNLTSIAYSMTMCTKALLGDPIPSVVLNDEVDGVALKAIRDVMQIHSNYWTALKPYRKFFPLSKKLVKLGDYETKTDSMSELIDKLEICSNNNANETRMERAQNNLIPEPPKASGEPSLSIPGVSVDTVMPGTAIAIDPNHGSGESIVRVVSEHEPNFEIGAVGQELEVLEGAVGGTNDILTAQDVYTLIVGNGNEDGQQMFVVNPLKWCPHLEQINPVPRGWINTKETCEDCRSANENWVCLTCYSVFCSRYVREHMVMHSIETNHKVTLSFSDLSVWCYACNAYIDCDICNEAKNAAHQDKFGLDLGNQSFSSIHLSE